MKFAGDHVIFESTGRRDYTYGEGFACHISSPNQIYYGSDGAIGDLTSAERQEVAKYMIDMWMRWAALPPWAKAA